jgi:hypothetical protein
MRNRLPKQIKTNESGIVNLDDYKGPGTHWVAYKKKGNNVRYFDSYGNLPPPRELLRYLCGKGRIIEYNDKTYQQANEWNCGHLCLEFLSSP